MGPQSSAQGEAPGDLPPVLRRLQRALEDAGIEFHTMVHEPVYTSAQAAAARNTPLHTGAKALVMHTVADFFVLVVLPADMGLDSNALRHLLETRRLRFATGSELLELTGLTPGCVPPMGSLFGLKTICDPTLGENPRINFSAGSHRNSIQMSFEDYLAFERPSLERIAKST